MREGPELTSEVESLKETIEDSNRDQRRRHTESIHIIFATAVIGSYFTGQFQKFITTQNITFITNIFASLSVVYVILKLGEITLRDSFQPYGSSFIFGFLSPLIYIVAVFGYLLVVVSEMMGLSKFISLELGKTIAIGLVFISIPYALFEFKRYMEIRKYSINKEGSTGEKFEKLIARFPTIVEKGLTVSMEQPTIQSADANIRLDYIGEDNEGNTVLIEAKTGDMSVERAKYTIELINNARNSGSFDIDRSIVAHTEEIYGEPKDLFERENIELIKVDPYSAYGIFSSLFRFLDKIKKSRM